MNRTDLLLEVATYTVLFLLLWQVIAPLYLKPYFALLLEREERTAGDEKRAYARREQTREIVRQLEQKRYQARLEGLKVRDEQIQQARGAAAEIIKAAERKADSELVLAKAQIDLAKAKALGDVEAEASKISEAIVSKVLTAGGERTLH